MSVQDWTVVEIVLRIIEVATPFILVILAILMNSIKKKTNESAKTMETVKTNVEQFIGQLNLIHDMKELNVYAPKST